MIVETVGRLGLREELGFISTRAGIEDSLIIIWENSGGVYAILSRVAYLLSASASPFSLSSLRLCLAYGNLLHPPL